RLHFPSLTITNSLPFHLPHRIQSPLFSSTILAVGIFSPLTYVPPSDSKSNTYGFTLLLLSPYSSTSSTRRTCSTACCSPVLYDLSPLPSLPSLLLPSAPPAGRIKSLTLTSVPKRHSPSGFSDSSTVSATALPSNAKSVHSAEGGARTASGGAWKRSGA